MGTTPVLFQRGSGARYGRRACRLWRPYRGGINVRRARPGAAASQRPAGLTCGLPLSAGCGALLHAGCGDLVLGGVQRPLVGLGFTPAAVLRGSVDTVDLLVDAAGVAVGVLRALDKQPGTLELLGPGVDGCAMVSASFGGWPCVRGAAVGSRGSGVSGPLPTMGSGITAPHTAGVAPSGEHGVALRAVEVRQGDRSSAVTTSDFFGSCRDAAGRARCSPGSPRAIRGACVRSGRGRAASTAGTHPVVFPYGLLSWWPGCPAPPRHLAPGWGWFQVHGRAGQPLRRTSSHTERRIRTQIVRATAPMANGTSETDRATARKLAADADGQPLAGAVVRAAAGSAGACRQAAAVEAVRGRRRPCADEQADSRSRSPPSSQGEQGALCGVGLGACGAIGRAAGAVVAGRAPGPKLRERQPRRRESGRRRVGGRR